MLTQTHNTQAFDAVGAAITTPWLGEPVAKWGVSPNGASDMPGWSFDAGSGLYTFNGGSVPGNPTVGLAMPSLARIYKMELTKSANNNAFAIVAPVSGPLGAGTAAGEAALNQHRGVRVVQPDHRHAAVQHSRFGGGVVRKSAVPVQVVLGDV